MIFKRKKGQKVFISINPNNIGGGSNTFAYQLKKWLKNQSLYVYTKNISSADIAIVIADTITMRRLKKARGNSCFIIHRIDEHVEHGEVGYRKMKHEKIRLLNRYANQTVYQSKFVYENMHPYLGSPKNYKIIHNGSDPTRFYPAKKPGEYIGHITWGVGYKKRLDILYDVIKKNTDKNFLLVGNHHQSKYDFSKLKNANIVGPIGYNNLLYYLHKMKFLFFPSENDPCPNTVIEALLSGVPVCYNKKGGTVEIVQECGVSLTDFKIMVSDWRNFKAKTSKRDDLRFDIVAEKYLNLYNN
jgi:glycosyltransferase involved in cell wall biosynthesis|tara:strand:- start:914 stop:1813 length:900 start_codon:yes stop_codon:yes gene_type:complete